MRPSSIVIDVISNGFIVVNGHNATYYETQDEAMKAILAMLTEISNPPEAPEVGGQPM